MSPHHARTGSRRHKAVGSRRLTEPVNTWAMWPGSPSSFSSTTCPASNQRQPAHVNSIMVDVVTGRPAGWRRPGQPNLTNAGVYTVLYVYNRKHPAAERTCCSVAVTDSVGGIVHTFCGNSSHSAARFIRTAQRVLH